MVSFHIEPTSKCTLECPLCDRTWFYETFKKRNLHEINVDNVVDFIGTNKKVSLSGNNGDPIYHSSFLELIRKLKDNNCSLNIGTNGSAKTRVWWQKLNDLLDDQDTITFAIDGLEDTNHIYRKNAKWSSIMDAIDVLANRKCKIVWKFIVFKHNQHQIKDAKLLSNKLNFNDFELVHSDRWLGKKELMPDREFTDTAYEQAEQVLIDKDYKATMNPYCMKHGSPSNLLYVDAEGDFYPCCFIGTYRYKYKTLFSPKHKKFNIKNITFEQIMQDTEVKSFFQSTKDFDSAHECCKIKCGVKNG